MKRRKAIADMELFASAESGMEQASFDGGAGRRIRTPDLLITNQLLYRLSYTSVSAATWLLYHPTGRKVKPQIRFYGKNRRQPLHRDCRRKISAPAQLSM